jgi:AcrR family transcriptional regulator
MPRPSKNIDKLLIKTGLEMLQETGVSQLNIRELVERAGVNLGMFHYHFKSKETFSRLVLQELYESIFSKLTHDIDESQPAIELLKQTLRTLVRFLRDNRRIIVGILRDISSGDPVVQEFASSNFPRHFGLLATLVMRAQSEKAIVAMPCPQVVAFLAGAVATPLLAFGIASPSEGIGSMLQALEPLIISDSALDQRINMAIKGVST